MRGRAVGRASRTSGLAGHPLCRLALALALTALGSVAVAVAQEPETQQTFEGESSVVLVQVPVHVTDRNGEPIRDLEAEDFRLWDDGEEQVLERVEVIFHDEVTADPRPAPSQLAADDLPAAARRKLLLLFDLSFARPASVVKARAAALDFVLQELAPGDLAAVATVSVEQGARLLVTFTTDRAQLARAIDTLGQPGLTGPASGDPLRFVLERQLPTADTSRDNAGAQGQFDRMLEEQLDLFRRQRRRVEQSHERGRIADWTRSLASLAGSLSELQGDKYVVVFSEGFDGSLVFGRDTSAPTAAGRADQTRRENGLFWLVDPDDTFGNSALQSDVAEMARVFRRAGARLHAVDVGGLRSSARADEEAAVDSAPRGGRDSLFYVADATGGELLRDANDFAAGLTRLLRRSSVTYLLSFYPKNLADDGAYRELRVVAKDLPRGAKLSHREGYFAPRPFADLPPLERALLTSESLTAPQPKQDLAVEVLAAPFRAGAGASYVPVILEIDGASLTEHPGAPPDDDLRLEVYVYAGDRDGEIRDFATQQLRVARAAIREHRGVKFYAPLRLMAGPHQLRILVRDQVDGRTTVLTRTLEVPDWSRPVLLPPFAVQSAEQDWLMIRQESEPSPTDASTADGSPDEGTVVYPFLLEGEPYVPSALPAVRVDESLPVALVGYGFAATAEGWIVSILGDDGVAHPDGRLLDLKVAPTRVEGQIQLSGRLDPQRLRPGNYVLAITAPEAAVPAAGQEGISASMAFRVVP